VPSLAKSLSLRPLADEPRIAFILGHQVLLFIHA
jgi:hypothetical protein